MALVTAVRPGERVSVDAAATRVLGYKPGRKVWMKRIDVVKKGSEWIGESGKRVVARAPNKVDAVRKVARVARADPESVTVKIHKENGRFQQERTYPRRADPRKTKG